MIIVKLLPINNQQPQSKPALDRKLLNTAIKKKATDS